VAGAALCSRYVSAWPIATEGNVPRNIGDQGKCGLVALNVSFVARDPFVWSGRAGQEAFIDLAKAVVHQVSAL
jgi:hypothetical protein